MVLEFHWHATQLHSFFFLLWDKVKGGGGKECWSTQKIKPQRGKKNGTELDERVTIKWSKFKIIELAITYLILWPLCFAAKYFLHCIDFLVLLPFLNFALCPKEEIFCLSKSKETVWAKFQILLFDSKCSAFEWRLGTFPPTAPLFQFNVGQPLFCTRAFCRHTCRIYLQNKSQDTCNGTGSLLYKLMM